MNLTIDIGNSSVKYSVFDKERCIWHEQADIRSTQPVERAKSMGVQQVIISSVSDQGKEIEEVLSQANLPVYRLGQSPLRLPFRIGYKTPDTLGSDRIAAVAGAWKLAPGQSVLVIDMGTCITYDLLSNEGIFVGGNIAPGLKMRMRSMHEHTARLPLTEIPQDEPPFLGGTTYEAITSGAIWGIRMEAEGYYLHLKQQYPDIQVMVTGGDCRTLAHTLGHFASIHDSLVDTGLNTILDYQQQ